MYNLHKISKETAKIAARIFSVLGNCRVCEREAIYNHFNCAVSALGAPSDSVFYCECPTCGESQMNFHFYVRDNYRFICNPCIRQDHRFGGF